MKKKPEEIDVSTAASAMGRKRWAGMSEQERKVAMERARAERQRKLSKSQRAKIASTAAKARWAKARAAEQHPKAINTARMHPRPGAE